MSDPIDNLLDLLLDLETPNNKSNSQKKSSLKKQQTPSNNVRLTKLGVETSKGSKGSVGAQVVEARVGERRKRPISTPGETPGDTDLGMLTKRGEEENKAYPNSIETPSVKSENTLSSQKIIPPTDLETKPPKPIEPKKELPATKVTEVFPDNQIQALSSLISNLTDKDTTHSNSNDEVQAGSVVSRRSTLDSSSNYQKIILEDWITQKEEQLNELAESINNLIPLMVELLNVKLNNSQEVILQTIINLALEERSVQDLEKMAMAIAKLLPNAITQEIKIQPQSLGKALAPEMALSLEEQIRLDQDAISQALASEMGKAIKAQIELEKDAMVDALYPVIGNTISKYLAEEIKRINDKVENALSPEGISRKIRAKMQGVSEAELILQESLVCRVLAIFLIQKDSGLIIRDIQPDPEYPLESDLVGGMLTAIRSFANDCIASGSELNEIDYDKFQILLEVAGYCYIAVVIHGQPQPQFRDRIRATLSKIVMQYGDRIQRYDGNPSTIPPSINLLLKDLTIVETDATTEGPKKSFTALWWLGGILLVGILVPWGILKYRAVRAERITQEVAIELDSNPELSVYRLQPQVDQGNITITGKVPSNYLRNLAQEIVTKIATSEDLNLDNQIIAVNVPPDPTLTAQEVTRVMNLLNQLKGVAIAANYQDDIVTVTGFVLEAIPTQTFTSAFSNIPGVKQVIFTVEKELPTLDTRIYFDSGVSELNKTANSSNINSIKQFLNQYPSLNLKVIGHSDNQGLASANQKLALERANNVYQQAIARGVNPKRLEVVASVQRPPDVAPDQPLWLSRCVRFEPFISKQNSP
ncbi:MAG: OmpA family protein [Xenococcaceae cyanobacterium MO_234.B1]|nr:OmpA family protein [Xenococcaceae cyanobacterium MO_234.B1]